MRGLRDGGGRGLFTISKRPCNTLWHQVLRKQSGFARINGSILSREA